MKKLLNHEIRSIHGISFFDCFSIHFCPGVHFSIVFQYFFALGFIFRLFFISSFCLGCWSKFRLLNQRVIDHTQGRGVWLITRGFNNLDFGHRKGGPSWAQKTCFFNKDLIIKHIWLAGGHFCFGVHFFNFV